MITASLRKYITLIFITATFMGVFHHHNDGQQHNDCKICMVQSSIANADTPVDVLYLSLVESHFESIITHFTNLHTKRVENSLYARAPPHIS